MKGILSSLLFALLLFGVGAVALASKPFAVIESQAESVQAPTAPENWSALAIPLIVTPTKASEVAEYIDPGGSITRISMFSNQTQQFQTWNAAIPFLNDFAISVGDSPMVRADNSLPSPVLTWVGDVPPTGTVTYTLQVGWNSIMVPLDQNTTAIYDAETLATSIGGISRVAYWDGNNQQFLTWNSAIPFLNNFTVRIGYPYLVYSDGTVNTWP